MTWEQKYFLLVPALWVPQYFASTEHAENYCVWNEIWDGRNLEIFPYCSNFSMIIFLDPSLGDFFPPQVNLKQHLQNITNKIICEDITLLKYRESLQAVTSVIWGID